MNDAVAMRRDQGIENLGRQRQQPAEWKAATGNDLGKRPPLQILHRHEERSAIALDGVHRHDIGVIQCGNDLRLALEALEPDRVGCDLAWEELQSDLAFEASIFREVHVAHPAMPQRSRNAVVSERSSHHGGE